MMKQLLPILLVTLGFSNTDMQTVQQALAANNQKLVINNRPLIKIQGKTISLMDVVKKMDLYLHANFPQAKTNKAMLFQFYTQQWRRTLDEMIMEQLILADSEGKDMGISEGDVRQEMDQRFGPETILNLKEIGLSYEEAKELVKNDMIVQRLLWYRVYSKAQASVRPDDIKTAYTAYLDHNPVKEEWEYDVLTVRGEDSSLCERVAQQASSMLGAQAMELSSLASDLSKKHKSNKLKIVASKDYKVDTKTVSAQHKEILAQLESGQTSAAIKQTSRSAGVDVYRVFRLKSHNKIEPESFDVMHNRLKEELFGQESMKHREEYNTVLREMFGYTAEELEKIVPKDYQPFAMQ